MAHGLWGCFSSWDISADTCSIRALWIVLLLLINKDPDLPYSETALTPVHFTAALPL